MIVSLPHRSVCVLAGPALVAAGALLSGTGPAGNCAGVPSLSASSSAPTPIGVYRASCLECHDVDGRGGVSRESLPALPDFTDPKWQSSRSDADLARSILDGKGKLMPKMKKKLGSVDVKAMVAFVRGFKDGKQVVEEEPEVGSEPEKRSEGSAALAEGSRSGTPSAAGRSNQAQRGINKNFQRFCSMCHGASGDGSNARDTMKAIPNFTSAAWQSKRTDPQLRASILDGKGSEMPAFRSKLSRDQARELIAFIRGFSATTKRPSRGAADDFEARYRKLEKELEDLMRQSRTLASPAPSAPAGPAAKGTKP